MSRDRHRHFRLVGTLLIAASLILGACGAEETAVDVGTGPSPATTSAVTTSPVTTGSAVNDLSGFGRATVSLSGEPITVAVADTPVLRSQGLMGVTDLVDVEGMLFVFDSEVEATFWMKDTLIPLDIWFFDPTGGFVDTFTMTPCETASCRTYSASGPYQYALETEVGRIDPGQTPRLDL